MTSRMKRKVCETCGLSLTPTEYDKMWRKIRDDRFKDEETPNRHKEYLKWYESSKNE